MTRDARQCQLSARLARIQIQIQSLNLESSEQSLPETSRKVSPPTSPTSDLQRRLGRFSYLAPATGLASGNFSIQHIHSIPIRSSRQDPVHSSLTVRRRWALRLSAQNRVRCAHILHQASKSNGFSPKNASLASNIFYTRFKEFCAALCDSEQRCKAPPPILKM